MHLTILLASAQTDDLVFVTTTLGLIAVLLTAVFRPWDDEEIY